MHVLHAVDAVVVAGQRPRVDELFPERFVENLADQRALAGSGCASDRDELTEWDVDIHGLEIVFPGTANVQHLAGARSALRRRPDCALARQKLSCWRRLAREQITQRALDD